MNEWAGVFKIPRILLADCPSGHLSVDEFKKIYEFDMAYRDVAARVESSYGG